MLPTAVVKPVAILRILSGNSSPSIVSGTNVAPIEKYRHKQNNINGTTDTSWEWSYVDLCSYDLAFGGKYKNPYAAENVVIPWIICDLVKLPPHRNIISRFSQLSDFLGLFSTKVV